MRVVPDRAPDSHAKQEPAGTESLRGHVTTVASGRLEASGKGVAKGSSKTRRSFRTGPLVDWLFTYTADSETDSTDSRESQWKWSLSAKVFISVVLIAGLSTLAAIWSSAGAKQVIPSPPTLAELRQSATDALIKVANHAYFTSPPTRRAFNNAVDMVRAHCNILEDQAKAPAEKRGLYTERIGQALNAINAAKMDTQAAMGDFVGLCNDLAAKLDAVGKAPGFPAVKADELKRVSDLLGKIRTEYAETRSWLLSPQPGNWQAVRQTLRDNKVMDDANVRGQVQEFLTRGWE